MVGWRKYVKDVEQGAKDSQANAEIGIPENGENLKKKPVLFFLRHRTLPGKDIGQKFLTW